VSGSSGVNITGKFIGSAVPAPGSVISHTLNIEYANQQVYLIYQSELPKWVWGIVGVGIATVVIAFGAISFIVLKRWLHRGEYETL